MEGILYFILYIILPIAIPIGLALYLASRKNMLAAKLLMAFGVAIPFFFMGVFVLFISFFGSRKRPYNDEYYIQTFTVVNYSSIPWVADANFSYTKEELESFQWEYTIPWSNFTVYDKVYIPQYTASARLRSNQYSFDTPIRHDSCTHWPSGAYLILSDTQGNQLVHLNAVKLDSITRNKMVWEVTDSLLHAINPSASPTNKKGGNP